MPSSLSAAWWLWRSCSFSASTLSSRALPAILEIGPINFLFGTRWYASTGDFGIFAIILTSFAGTAGAILVGVPIGLMTAIFLSKGAPPKFAAVVHAAVELLAGIPSVVYGLVGMILLVPAIRVAFDPDMELIGLSAGLQKSSWSLSNLVNNFTGLFRGD